MPIYEYKCQKCNKHQSELDVGLHCHHVEGIMWNPIESADVDMCITYCKTCHTTIHQILINVCRNRTAKRTRQTRHQRFPLLKRELQLQILFHLRNYRQSFRRKQSYVSHRHYPYNWIYTTILLLGNSSCYWRISER